MSKGEKFHYPECLEIHVMNTVAGEGFVTVASEEF